MNTTLFPIYQNNVINEVYTVLSVLCIRLPEVFPATKFLKSLPLLLLPWLAETVITISATFS